MTLDALKKASWPWLGGLGVGVLLVVLRWNSLEVPLVRDEGEYAYAAQLLKCGRLPYEASFLQKPPMVVYAYALANMLAPNTFWFPRVLAGLSAAVVACLLGLIARLEFGAGIALPAAWLITPMLLFPGLWQFTANTEIFMLVPLLATITVYVISRYSDRFDRDWSRTNTVGSLSGGLHQSSRPAPSWLTRFRGTATGGRLTGPGSWFAAGVLAAITLWFKYTAIPVLTFVFTAWSIEAWRAGQVIGPVASEDDQRMGRRIGLRIVSCWLWGWLGAIIASGVILAPFVAHDGGRRLWECTVEFNRYYATTAGFGFAALWSNLLLLLEPWWVLLVLLVVCCVRRRPRAWFWAGVFLAAWVSTGASAYGHYYLVIMPFWALLAAVAIDDLALWAANRLAHHGAGPVDSQIVQDAAGPPAQRWLRRLITVFVLVLLCLPDLPWITCSQSAFAAEKAGGGNPFLESQAVARRVAQMTSANDAVYVAGSEPQILCYAHRFSPTRFVIAYPMMFPTPLAEGYQREAIQDLERQRPAVIVFARSATSWLRQEQSPTLLLAYLEKLLADRYERVGGWLPEGQGGRWQEPLPEQDLANASLVLFRQKPH